MYLQYQEETNAHKSNSDKKQSPPKTPTGYKLLEERYKRLRNIYKKEQEKNMQLLHNNNVLVLEKEQLKSKISMLEERIERLNRDKVRTIK